MSSHYIGSSIKSHHIKVKLRVYSMGFVEAPFYSDVLFEKRPHEKLWDAFGFDRKNCLLCSCVGVKGFSFKA